MSYNWKLLSKKQTDLENTLLENRKIKNTKLFFYGDKNNLNSPFLFSNMQIILDRINKSIKNKERIMIFGDYDADGILSTVILLKTILYLKGNVSYRLPHRELDGYGIKEKHIKEFKRNNINLIITVDNGISCYKAIDYCKKNNIDIIITDHHKNENKNLNTKYILHSQDKDYPFKYLCGCGIALKLAEGLLKSNNIFNDNFFDYLITLASIATVADIVPLIDENRIIVKEGLKNINTSKILPVQKILDIASIRENIDTWTIGYIIAPHINATGRLKNADIAMGLFLKPKHNLEKISKEIYDINNERKNIVEKILKKHDKDYSKNKIIIIKDENIHIGIIGLIAGKLSNLYNVPCIVCTYNQNDIVCSGRSTEHIDLHKILSKYKDLFLHFGGHKKALGLSIKEENFDLFEEKINNYFDKYIKKQKPTLKIDMILELENLNKIYEIIEKFQPFGEKNEEPIFTTQNVKIIKYDILKKLHLKLQLQYKDNIYTALYFNFNKNILNSNKLDIVYKIRKDKYNKIFLDIIDFKLKV